MNLHSTHSALASGKFAHPDKSSSPASVWKWFALRDQPPRRPFGFAAASESGAIHETVVMEKPFGALVKFTSGARREKASPTREILLIAPLSGHFAFLLRDMVAGLAPDADVYVIDWINARHASPSLGDFGFYDNIAYILESLRRLGPDAHVIAVCQAVVPALAAVALACDETPERAPASLTLMAGPVDPLANPTQVVRSLRDHPLHWYRDRVIAKVGEGSPGAGRLVYPASTQLQGLMAYFTRHMTCGLELYEKATQDDGDDSDAFPFLDLYASIMDLPATFFLENTELVFHERAAWTGRLSWNGQPIDFGSIRGSALMTIEGERDDIAAPGQTEAAHCLCHKAPNALRRRFVAPGAGHFSLFHGGRWRRDVLPQIKAFMTAAEMR
jgi:poly(3-hydroxybutyrate) depolymerase